MVDATRQGQHRYQTRKGRLKARPVIVDPARRFASTSPEHTAGLWPEQAPLKAPEQELERGPLRRPERRLFCG
jgi:hypothetical protein